MDSKSKVYHIYGVNTAIQLLRPGAKWEMSGSRFVSWDDPRPRPTWEEIKDTMEKIRKFEESIETVWTDEQRKALFGGYEKMEEELKNVDLEVPSK